MARPIASPIEDLVGSDEHIRQYPMEPDKDGMIEVFDLTSGMVTAIPRNKIPSGAMSLIVNGRIDPFGIITRPGTSKLTPVKPDDNKVYKIVLALNEAGEPIIVRFALGSLSLLIDNTWIDIPDFISLEEMEANEDGNGWWLFTPYDGVGGSTFTKQAVTGWELLLGDPIVDAPQIIVRNYEGFLLLVPPHLAFRPEIYVTQMFNYIFITDQIGQVGYISLDGQAHNDQLAAGRITTSPVAKYITVFGDRVVVANIVEGGEYFPNDVAWSPNSDPFGDWINDETSGRESLIQSAFGLGDHITGIFGLEDECVILRRQSIWTMVRQAFATSPFRFSQYISDFGCDLPYSAAAAGPGIIWADRRTRSIYRYLSGATPQKLSQAVDDADNLKGDLEDPIWVEGAYDPFRKEYLLGISLTADEFVLNKLWIFNLETGSFVQDDSPEVTCLARIAGTLDTQDQLIFPSFMFKGTEDGEIIYHDEEATTDYDESEFGLELISPDIGSASRVRTLKDFMARIHVLSSLDITLDLSNDGENWRNEITLSNLSVSSTHRNIGLRKQKITGNELFWRIRSVGRMHLHSWWAQILEKRMQR